MMFHFTSHTKGNYKETDDLRLDTYEGCEFNRKGGFRLKTVSEPEVDRRRYLIKCEFKQRIDSMFEETRSAIMGTGERRIGENKDEADFRGVYYSGRPTTDEKGSCLFEQYSSYKERIRAKNIVQARIEKMFTDVSSSEFEDDVEKRGKKPLRYQVDYMGSLPSTSKVTSLEGLQEPLKNLYFGYRKNRNPGSRLQAVLEISDHGLKVHNFEGKCGRVVEELNPFPKIAVWAALKFACRRRPLQADNGMAAGYEYAFLPLVVDPANAERSNLFRELNHEDFPYAIEKTYDDHSPLFVVIMKKNDYSPSSQLQCHGFVCATSEDAIVLAANLYKALVVAMNQNQTNIVKKRKKIKCRYGLGVVGSVGGSSISEEPDYLFSKEEEDNKPDHASNLIQQRNEKGHCNENSRNGFHNTNSLLMGKTTDEDNNMRLKDKMSMENVDYIRTVETTYCDATPDPFWSSTVNESLDSGDILTKVVIPRSGSFLNASVPVMSRYNRLNSHGNGFQLQSRKNSVRSPLGFNELFAEFRIREGLNNIDEILDAIIDVNGMSFNSLKPIYKEFIFKFAVTLTKDELFQRSKSIMHKQKRRKQKATHRKRTFKTGHKLKRAIQASWSKFRPSIKYHRNRRNFPSNLFPAFQKIRNPKGSFRSKGNLKNHEFSVPSASNSFMGMNKLKKTNFTYHPSDTIYSAKPFYLWRDNPAMNSSAYGGHRLPISLHSITSFPLKIDEENGVSTNDSCERKSERSPTDRGLQQQSLGYFSCSDNSESCVYNTLQKCYCSIGKTIKAGDNVENEIKVSPVSSCSCDTDSCLESEKCYCNQTKKMNIFEQLKQQGFAASESSLSRSGSPTPGKDWKRKEELIDFESRQGKGKTCVKASKSLEFFHVERNFSEGQIKEERVNRLHSTQISIYDDPFKAPILNRKSNWKVNAKKESKRSQKKSFVFSNNVTGSRFQNVLLRNVSFRKYNDDLDAHILAEDYCSDNDYHNNYGEDESEHYEDDDDDNDIDVGSGNFTKDDNQNRIMVVSARDQKGQVKQLFTPISYGNRSNLSRSEHGNDAMSVKKSAEIAALFSEVKIDKKNLNSNCDEDNLFTSMRTSESILWKGKGSLCIKNTNLENSLGYFP